MNENPQLTPNPTLPKDVTNWAMIIYFSCLFGFIVPFGNIIVPFVLWWMKKEEHPFINKQGKEMINFQISLTICFIALFILSLIFGMIFAPLSTLVTLLSFAIGLGALVFVIIGAIKVSEGVDYAFPYNFRFLK